MCESGKIRHTRVVPAEPGGVDRLARSPDEIVVGQHHTLGGPRGPGCVDEGGELVGLECGQPDVELLGGDAGTLGVELLPGHHHGIVNRRAAPHHDYMLERGNAVADLFDLLPLPRILDHQERRLGVLEYVETLSR